ncbi:MAG: methionine--tRNA ligase [Bacilli bacterium]|nr:methionine--tRNA ligase [Bacilli bacterium]
MEKKRLYITTPIYYPSGNPHIGHAYCTTLADVIARDRRMRHYETYFLTGTDEHGQKIEKNARLAGLSPLEYVDNMVAVFKKLWEALKISNDDFIRTTQERHVECVQKVFSNLYKNDDIYLGKYEGWYCTPCESFWTETQVGPEHICPDCGRPVEKSTEECFFFKTKKYLNKVLSWYEDPKSVYPESRKNEMVNTFIKPGLEDLCVSRTSFKWGVPLKEGENHISYVWLDALVNYISALGYGTDHDELYQKFWASEETEIIHLIGADITRFHTIYWPEFLTSIGARLPDRVFVHGLLMMKDGKMSKSKGNVVSPYPLIERYGVDAVRYYLVREVVFGQDGQFTPEQFVERINADLVNNLGNLVSRTVSMVDKYFGGKIPEFKSDINEFDHELEIMTNNTINSYVEKMNNLEVTEAYIDVMNLLGRANKYIEESTPWVLAKDENKKENLESVMSHLARVIFVGSKLLEPILVDKSKEIFIQLGLNELETDFDNLSNVNLLNNHQVNKTGVLFPRLDVAKEVEYIKNLMGGNK